MRSGIMTSFERIDETMACQLYAPNEKGTFEQDPRGECFSMPHQSTHSECSPNGMNQKTSRRTSPGKDPGSKNRSAKRRSSIACNRCRQRKIKCSGENDEGLACTNCQSAGYTNCHFVRVNSKVLQTKAPGFPFSALGATKTESMYAQHHMDPHKSAALSNVRIVPPQGYASYDMGAVDHHPSSSRQPYSIDYECQQQQQSIQAYNGPTTILPSSAPQGSLDDCYESWNSFNNDNDKNSTETVFQGQATNHSLTQAYPYLLLGQGGTRSDIPSLVDDSLGSDGSSESVERTIPAPTSQAQPQTNFLSLTSSPEAMSNLSFSPGNQTDNPWGESKYGPPATTTHCSPMHSITSQPFNMSPRDQARPDSDMVLGFVPMTPPLLPFTTLENINSIPTTTAAAATYSTTTGDDLRVPNDARFVKSPQDNNSRLLSISTASAASSDCSHADSFKYSFSSNGSTSESAPNQSSDTHCALPHASMSVNAQDQSTAAMWASSGALASVELQRTLQGY